MTSTRRARDRSEFERLTRRRLRFVGRVVGRRSIPTFPMTPTPSGDRIGDVVFQQQGATFLGGDSVGLSAVDEVGQDLHEAEGLLDMGEVAGSLDDLEPAPGYGVVR